MSAMPVAVRRLLAASSTRLVVLTFGVQLLIIILAMGSVYAAARGEVATHDKAMVVEMRDDLLAVWRAGGLPELKAVVSARSTRLAASQALLLADRNGDALAGNIPGLPAGVKTENAWHMVELSGPQLAPSRHLVLLTRLDPNHVLVVGYAQARSDAMLKAIGQALAASLILTIPAAFGLAFLLTRLSAARVSGIAGVALAVVDGDLARRAPRDGSNDPYDRLAGVINDMLDRIARLVDELRTVTDGLAHDLRSPLSRLRGRVEQAQTRGADAETFEAMASDLDRLLSMLSTALQISRAEAGIGRDHFSITDVAGLLADTVDIYGPVAEEHGVEMAAQAPSGLACTLHQPLIQQALGNAIENSLRHASGASSITLCANAVQDGIELIVADDGPGIPPERHALALSRFGRLDPARGDAGMAPGNAGMGLGLALVSAVARLHGGSVVLASNNPGLKLVIRLPQVPLPPTALPSAP